jgi:iron transport multicopper oxidase
MQRDVLMVRPQGHFVIRFRSDNPGVWLFHCKLLLRVLSDKTDPIQAISNGT